MNSNLAIAQWVDDTAVDLGVSEESEAADMTAPMTKFTYESMIEYQVYKHIQTHPGATIESTSECLELDAPDVFEAILSLQERGLVGSRS